MWDFVGNPAMAMSILFGFEFDEFQKCALTIGALTPNVLDSSGYSSSRRCGCGA